MNIAFVHVKWLFHKVRIPMEGSYSYRIHNFMSYSTHICRKKLSNCVLTWSTRTERLASTSCLLAVTLATTVTAIAGTLLLRTVHPLTSTGPHTPPDRQVLLAQVKGFKILCMLLHLRRTVMPMGAVGQSRPTETSGRQQGPGSTLQYMRKRLKSVLRNASYLCVYDSYHIVCILFMLRYLAILQHQMLIRMHHVHVSEDT